MIVPPRSFFTWPSSCAMYFTKALRTMLRSRGLCGYTGFGAKKVKLKRRTPCIGPYHAHGTNHGKFKLSVGCNH